MHVDEKDLQTGRGWMGTHNSSLSANKTAGEPRYLGQLLLRGKAQPKHCVGSAIRPLAEFLRGFGEGHVGGDCAVYDHLFRNRSKKNYKQPHQKFIS